jgi:hypothetical protein
MVFGPVSLHLILVRCSLTSTNCSQPTGPLAVITLTLIKVLPTCKVYRYFIIIRSLTSYTGKSSGLTPLVNQLLKDGMAFLFALSDAQANENIALGIQYFIMIFREANFQPIEGEHLP